MYATLNVPSQYLIVFYTLYAGLDFEDSQNNKKGWSVLDPIFENKIGEIMKK